MNATAPVSGPPGLDLDRLAAYLDEACPGLLTRPLGAEVIAGGRSNLTYRVWGPDATMVLRRPPLGHVLPTAHDMAREFRVIAALHPTGFPVPVPVHFCPDPAIIGEPFYLMSYVDGRVLRGPDEIYSLSREAAARTGRLLIDTLVALHATDPDAIGLHDFGRPVGFLERQVRLWYSQWERSKTRELASLEAVATTLATTVPTSARAAIIHGDYRLDNVMVDGDVSRILAVLDWEMATLGDPLTDVGLLVVYTDLADLGLAPTQPQFGPDQGYASAAELIDRYASQAAGGLAVDRIGWYVALGYYKLAIISEGIHARYVRGKTVGAGFDLMGPAVPKLIEHARAALG